MRTSRRCSVSCRGSCRPSRKSSGNFHSRSLRPAMERHERRAARPPAPDQRPEPEGGNPDLPRPDRAGRRRDQRLHHGARRRSPRRGRCARAVRGARAAVGCTDRHQGRDRRRRNTHHGCIGDSGRQRPRERCADRGTTASGRRGHSRQAQHARVRLRCHDDLAPLWTVPQSLVARPDLRWLERWQRSGCCCRPRGGNARNGHRRLDPDPRVPVWRHRPAAFLGARPEPRGRSRLVDFRHSGTDCAECRGLRAHARCDRANCHPNRWRREGTPYRCRRDPLRPGRATHCRCRESVRRRAHRTRCGGRAGRSADARRGRHDQPTPDAPRGDERPPRVDANPARGVWRRRPRPPSGRPFPPRNRVRDRYAGTTCVHGGDRPALRALRRPRRTCDARDCTASRSERGRDGR